ncbi:hypothetical protein FOL47_011088, partial [Perkinsus chesapeaki]
MYIDLSEFRFPKHVFDNEVETLTTVTGEVVQHRRSDHKGATIFSIGQWFECFLRYATALQLSDVGRAQIDIGHVISYAIHIADLFTAIKSVRAVIEAEACYRNSGAMAIASGAVTMKDMFGSEAYIRPKLDMYVARALLEQPFRFSDRSPRYGKGKGLGKGKGKGEGNGGKGKGKGKGKGQGAQRSAPYSNEPPKQEQFPVVPFVFAVAPVGFLGNVTIRSLSLQLIQPLYNMPKRTRSAEAKARRNCRRRERRDTTMSNRERAEDLMSSMPDCITEQQAHLRFYNTTAYTSKGGWRDDVLDRLSDGSSRPEYCMWFDDSHQNCDGSLAQLQDALEGEVSSVLTPTMVDKLTSWSNLPRSTQADHSPFNDPEFATIFNSGAERLASAFATILGSSTAKSNKCGIRARLTRDLLISMSQPGIPEDLEICDEIQDGCHIGYFQPIRATGLWPKDKGPKHFGFGPSYEDGQVWKNYRSADDVADIVQKTLDDEVAKGHMERMPAAPNGAVITKLACVPKSNGKIRLIDDLRRSGINEKICCEETICLPGLASAAFLVQQQRKRCPDEDLVWIEADIASAFRHIPVCEEDQKLLLNHVGKCHLPSGTIGTYACPLVCGALLYYGVVISPAYTESSKGMIYVDDLGWITTKKESVRMLSRILLVYEALGLVVSYDKLRISSTPHNLGFEWDLPSQT